MSQLLQQSKASSPLPNMDNGAAIATPVYVENLAKWIARADEGLRGVDGLQPASIAGKPFFVGDTHCTQVGQHRLSSLVFHSPAHQPRVDRRYLSLACAGGGVVDDDDDDDDDDDAVAVLVVCMPVRTTLLSTTGACTARARSPTRLCPSRSGCGCSSLASLRRSTH